MAGSVLSALCVLTPLILPAALRGRTMSIPALQVGNRSHPQASLPELTATRGAEMGSISPTTLFYRGSNLYSPFCLEHCDIHTFPRQHTNGRNILFNGC